jgi:ribosomal protein S8
MHDHRPTIAGRARVAGLDARNARRTFWVSLTQISLTALKRLESGSGLDVYETTRDQVRRAFEGAGIVLLSTDKGEGVLRLHEATGETAARKKSR